MLDDDLVIVDIDSYVPPAMKLHKTVKLLASTLFPLFYLSVIRVEPTRLTRNSASFQAQYKRQPYFIHSLTN